MLQLSISELARAFDRADIPVNYDIVQEWDEEPAEAIQGFLEVARTAGVHLSVTDFATEVRNRPHKPPSRLPEGKMALYAFHGEDCWLKIGTVGEKSHARYTSQHYNAGSAPSTLAGS